MPNDLDGPRTPGTSERLYDRVMRELRSQAGRMVRDELLYGREELITAPRALRYVDPLSASHPGYTGVFSLYDDNQNQQRSSNMRTKIPAFPKVPVHKVTGKDPLMFAKVLVQPGCSVLYVKSQALEDLAAQICSPREDYLDCGNFPFLDVDGYLGAEIDYDVTVDPQYIQNHYATAYTRLDSSELPSAMSYVSHRFRSLNGAMVRSGRAIVSQGHLNLGAILRPGLGKGKRFALRFPITKDLALDISNGLVAAAKAVVTTLRTSGTAEAVLFEGAAP